MPSEPKSSSEVEVKIRCDDHASIRDRLEKAGFKISVPRQWEANQVFDTAGQTLRHSDMLLRLRQAGEKCVITWKGPSESGPHKSRPELETSIGSVSILTRILEKLAYRRTFRYEKYRTEYSQAGKGGVITVDETPIGGFLELEGPSEWIDETAAHFGFSQQDYILESYGALYLEHCRKHGLEPGDMVFPSHT